MTLFCPRPPETYFGPIFALFYSLGSFGPLGHTRSTGLFGRHSGKNPEDPGNALRAFPGVPLESAARIPPQKKTIIRAFPELSSPLGDRFGESLGGSQAPPSFWKVPGLPQKFPKLPRKFFGTYQQSRGSPEVSQTSPELPRTSPEASRTSPEVSPFTGKPDTLS